MVVWRGGAPRTRKADTRRGQSSALSKGAGLTDLVALGSIRTLYECGIGTPEVSPGGAKVYQLVKA